MTDSKRKALELWLDEQGESFEIDRIALVERIQREAALADSPALRKPTAYEIMRPLLIEAIDDCVARLEQTDADREDFLSVGAHLRGLIRSSDEGMLRLTNRRGIRLQDGTPESHVSAAMSKLEQLLDRRLELFASDNPGFAPRPDWLTCADAVDQLAQHLGIERNQALNRLLEACETGFLSVRFANLKYDVADAVIVHCFDDDTIPPDFWRYCREPGHATLDISRGIFSVRGMFERNDCRVKVSGIQFGSADVFSQAESSVVQKPDSIPQVRQVRSGRPRYEFWDDVIIAICAQVYRGDLKPSVQADIERAIADWLSANGHEAGTTAIRKRARAIWDTGMR